jgi:hypothetical protein
MTPGSYGNDPGERGWWRGPGEKWVSGGDHTVGIFGS